jgi:hypothetical protein
VQHYRDRSVVVFVGVECIVIHRRRHDLRTPVDVVAVITVEDGNVGLALFFTVYCWHRNSMSSRLASRHTKILLPSDDAQTQLMLIHYLY